MIKFKEIDSSTEMIIATSGSNYINYNRIISSMSIVQSADAFRDPTPSSSR